MRNTTRNPIFTIIILTLNLYVWWRGGVIYDCAKLRWVLATRLISAVISEINIIDKFVTRHVHWWWVESVRGLGVVDTKLPLQFNTDTGTKIVDTGQDEQDMCKKHFNHIII